MWLKVNEKQNKIALTGIKNSSLFVNKTLQLTVIKNIHELNTRYIPECNQSKHPSSISMIQTRLRMQSHNRIDELALHTY